MMLDNHIMPMGFHKGRAMKDVPSSYLDWLSVQPWAKDKYPEVIGYIDRCRVALDDDLDKSGSIPQRFRTLKDKLRGR